MQQATTQRVNSSTALYLERRNEKRVRPIHVLYVVLALACIALTAVLVVLLIDKFTRDTSNKNSSRASGNGFFTLGCQFGNLTTVDVDNSTGYKLYTFSAILWSRVAFYISHSGEHGIYSLEDLLGKVTIWTSAIDGGKPIVWVAMRQEYEKARVGLFPLVRLEFFPPDMFLPPEISPPPYTIPVDITFTVRIPSPDEWSGAPFVREDDIFTDPSPFDEPSSFGDFVPQFTLTVFNV